MNTIEEITHLDLERCTVVKNDDYLIAAYLGEARKKAFLNNPNLVDKKHCVMALARWNGVVVGRTMFYPTKMIINEEVYDTLSGSSLEVHEDFRQYAVGVDLMMYPICEHSSKLILLSGISKQALPIYTKLKYKVLEFPRLVLPQRIKPILKSKGYNNIFWKFIGSFGNLALKVWWTINKIRSYNIIQKFEIKNEYKVPQWVDFKCGKRYKYQELHDSKWLQWNLDYHFHDHPQNIQSFYGVYFDDEPIGWFMTKERYKENNNGALKNVLIGSIMEWESFDNSILSESDINKLALSTFSSNVDIVELATTDSECIKSMKQYGFIKYDNAHILFYDKTKKFKDASDINNWRIRYGYADVFLT